MFKYFKKETDTTKLQEQINQLKKEKIALETRLDNLKEQQTVLRQDINSILSLLEDTKKQKVSMAGITSTYVQKVQSSKEKEKEAK